MPPEMTLVPVDEPYRFAGLSTLWSLVWMPDGTAVEGVGRNVRAAELDARRRWRRQKCRRTRPLAIDGHEYRRRQLARGRRKRG